MARQTVSAAERIKEKAIELFRENGYAATSINDICKAAGVTKPTFYYHYKSKQELLDYSIFRPVLVTEETLMQVLEADSYWKQLWILSDMGIQQYIDAGRELVREVIKINLDENIGTFNLVSQDFFGVTEPVIRRGQVSGQIRNLSDPKELITEIWKTQVGCVLLWCIDAEYDLKKELFKALEVAYDIAPEYRFDFN